MSKKDELDEQKRLNRIMFDALKEIAKADGVSYGTHSALVYVQIAKKAIEAVTKKS